MLAIDGWDIGIIAVAALIATVALARMMSHRRAEAMNRFRRELPHEPPPEDEKK
jgi:hypothetical protein